MKKMIKKVIMAGFLLGVFIGALVAFVQHLKA